MPDNGKILVVGTTTDYIEWIRNACPGRALFLTDENLRWEADEPKPHPEEEILCDLEDIDRIRGSIDRHLRKWPMTIEGIACFDCESMELAASLAGYASLSYPSKESIRLCRDKHGSKSIWRGNQVRCPQVRLIRSADEAWSFIRETGKTCVLKPLTGSGSELVFHCGTENEVKWAVRTIQHELCERENIQSRLFGKTDGFLVAEEWIEGHEYSCDFLITDHQVRIIRLTRKIHHPAAPFGTTLAYLLLSPEESHEWQREELEQILLRGASALGINRAICMVDFLVNEEGIVLLEMTPRPGGDCIPHLVRNAWGLDMLQLNLDFAGRQTLQHLCSHNNGSMVGLRVHSDKAGRLQALGTENLIKDSRIKEINLIRKPGHRIAMPPQDYESWYLGHIIFQPLPEQDLTKQCLEIRQQLVVETAS